MSTSNQTNRSADSTIDWAEKLKASMDIEPNDTPTPPISEDDDLAALLRAQLQRSASPTSVDLPDVGDFEAEADEEAFDEEDIAEESLEEVFDEEDIAEESLEEVFDEEDIAEESLEEVFDEEDIAEESPEEELFDDENAAEEALTEEIFDEKTVDEESAAELSRPALTTTLTDGVLNGSDADEPIGGYRLRALDEQNTDLLRQYGRLGTADSGEPLDLFEQAKRAESMMRYETDAYETLTTKEPSAALADACHTEREIAEAQHPVHTASRVDDFLQVGLDELSIAETRRSPWYVAPVYDDEDEVEEEENLDFDDPLLRVSILDEEFPVGARTRAVPPKSRPTPTKQTDYTAHMPLDGEDARRSDTDLYIRLGYEDRLRRAEEQERIERMRDARCREATVTPRNETTVVADGREYTGRDRTDDVEHSYLRSRRRRAARAILAIVGTILALIYDIFPRLSSDVAVQEFVTSGWYAPIGILWFVLVLLPFVPRLWRGLRSLAAFEPARYSVCSLACVVTLVHSILACFVSPAAKLSFYSGIALFMLTIAAVSEYLVTVAEHRAFVVVSSGKITHLLTTGATPASSALHRTASTTTLTAVRAGRLSDYFARTAAYNPYMARLNYFLPVVLLSAIVGGGLNVLLGHDPFSDALRGFTATYLACLPAAYVLSMVLPLYMVNDSITTRGTAVVGTAAPMTYVATSTDRRGSTTVIFADGDALISTNRKEITLRDDPNLEEHRRLAAAVFEAIASPMADHSPADAKDTTGIRAEIVERAEQYLKLYLVDDRRRTATEVMMGSHEALARRGVRLPKHNMERLYKKSEKSEVLYLAFDRQFAIAYAAEYHPTRLFALTVAEFSKMGYRVAVTSYDPLVASTHFQTDDLAAYDIFLLSPDYVETPRASRSGGIVAAGRSTDLLYPFVACHHMQKAYHYGHLATWLGGAVGAVLSILAVIFLDGSIALSTGILFLWQLLTLAPPILFSVLPCRRSILLRLTTTRKDRE